MTNPFVAVQRRYAQLLPGLHRHLSRRFPQALWSGDPLRREVALTFDDGPDPRDTPALLDLLARHGVRATFFVCGAQLAARPDLGRAMAEAGHQVALHGYYHKPFLNHAVAPFLNELADLRRLIADATRTPDEAIQDVRPPYGLFTPPVLDALLRHRYRPVMWTIVPFHWHQTFDEAVAQVERQLGAGALIVLHEGMRAGPDVARLTEAVIERVRDVGLSFVTVEEMWAGHSSGAVGAGRPTTAWQRAAEGVR
ncbi:MAG: chitooligosaccharide deacetylase NodB-like protein [Candidatus Roseilinea sp.]|nr:MAG: chitooligosaccharide deacetylase NodB-like protein [Candidatus Roseilinea sp.]